MGINTLPEMEARKQGLTPASELSGLKTLIALMPSTMFLPSIIFCYAVIQAFGISCPNY